MGSCSRRTRGRACVRASGVPRSGRGLRKGEKRVNKPSDSIGPPARSQVRRLEQTTANVDHGGVFYTTGTVVKRWEAQSKKNLRLIMQIEIGQLKLRSCRQDRRRTRQEGKRRHPSSAPRPFLFSRENTCRKRFAPDASRAMISSEVRTLRNSSLITSGMQRSRCGAH